MAIYSSKCTQLERYNGTNWDAISQKLSISWSGYSKTIIESSHIDCDTSDPHSGFTRKRAGTINSGTLDVEVDFDPSIGSDPNKHGLIRSDSEGSSAVQYRITFPNTAKTLMTVTGIVSAFSVSASGPESNLTASFTIEIDGKPTFEDTPGD